MLVLSRKQGQSIIIGHDIVVNVVDIGRGRVQIGVSAPAHMSIHREEIYQRIQQRGEQPSMSNWQAAELACSASC
ncbi:MAG TPA: carbon storage regulator CsrA [Pirellulales bacterium]|jgi:carbon storage regulator|nr:carbon storage regulator CsrA [Pirellulales bacterium]